MTGQSRSLAGQGPRLLRSPVLWICLLGLVPLLVTPVVPLFDFYAHVARYYVLAHSDSSAWLAENYAVVWQVVPNLGLDLIGMAMMAVVPPVLGAKLLAGLVVFAPLAGVLRLSRALHGRVPLANGVLAGFVMYSFVLGWGFANFLLGLGLALWALALWIESDGRRVGVAMAFGVVIMLVHGFVFALWGLMLCAVARPGGAVAARLGRLALVAAPAVLLFAVSQTVAEADGITRAFDNLAGHAERGTLAARLWDEVLQRGDSLLRVAESRFVWLDRGLGLVLWGAVVLALWRGWITVVPVMRVAVGLAALLIIVMPPNMFGVGFLDDRMPLVLLCLLAASLRVQGGAPVVMVPAMLALCLAHLGLVTLGWAQDGRMYRAYLAQIETAHMGERLGALYATGDRDAQRVCRPLAPLLLLTKEIAVPTFAHPGQQPLRLVGPLADAVGKGDGAAGIADLHAAGFDTVIACLPDGSHTAGGVVRISQDGQVWDVPLR